MTLTLTQNILATYERANDAELAQGTAWYHVANALAVELSPHDIARGAGVIAALSPQLDWERNQLLARRAFENDAASGCLPASCVKANKILAGGAPLDVLGGNKVRSFYANILDPAANDAVTIDRHAYDVAMGRVTNDKERGELARKVRYEAYVDAYLDAATLAGLRGLELQAITWVTWRREKGL